MALKHNYNRSVSLRCATCGATHAFETDVTTGYITCKKCNRVYRGGKDELIRLNESHIEDEKRQIVEEVKRDVEKEIQKMFKSLKM